MLFWPICHQIVLDYAKSEGIAHIHPRAILAVAEHNPKIGEEQDGGWIYIHSGLTFTLAEWAEYGELVPCLFAGRGGSPSMTAFSKDEFYGGAAGSASASSVILGHWNFRVLKTLGSFDLLTLG